MRLDVLFAGSLLVAACSSSNTRPPPSGDITGGSSSSSGSQGTTDAGDGGEGGSDGATSTDAMVLVPANTAYNLKAFWIDSFEAKVGTGGKAVSVAGVDPEVNIDYAGAKAACETAGKRLCTYHEWKVACRGPQDLRFAFQADDTNLVATCDVARTTNNTPGSLPSKTKAHPQCKTSGSDVWDMIGNLTEWTTNDADGVPIAAGAAFYQPTSGSDCEATLNKSGTGPMPPTEKATDIGFRCCRNN